MPFKAETVDITLKTSCQTCNFVIAAIIYVYILTNFKSETLSAENLIQISSFQVEKQLQLQEKQPVKHIFFYLLAFILFMLTNFKLEAF